MRRVGGGLVAENANNKGFKRTYYGCQRHRHGGDTVCTNALRMPVEDVNEEVLRAIEEHILTPEAIDTVVTTLTKGSELRDEQQELRDELQDIEKKIGKYAAAVAAAPDVKSILGELRKLETRRAEIEAQLAALRPQPGLNPKALKGRLEEWRQMLRASTRQ
jgi:hypothetical protein